MATNNYPNLTEDEINWLVNSAALRRKATVKDLIDSFFQVFPERTTHPDLSPRRIRDILTSRFNDILYRKQRGYTQIIADKRAVFQEILKDIEVQASFKSTFSVLNAVSLLHFHEQIFTNPKAKPSDKFKAINAAEELRVRMAKELQAAEKEKAEAIHKEETSLYDDDEIYFFHTIYNLQERYLEKVLQQLSEPLKQEIEKEINANPFNTPAEMALYTLEAKGMSDAVEKVRSIIHDPRPYEIGSKLSSSGRQKFANKFSKDTLQQMSLDELDTLLDIYIDVLL